MFPVVRNLEQLRNDYLTHEFTNDSIILVDMAYPELKRPRVIFDNRLSGFEMTQYLIEKGHRNIAFMYPEKTEPEIVNYSVVRRYQGFREAVSVYAGIGVSGSEWTLRNRDSEGLRSWADIEPNLHEKLYLTLNREGLCIEPSLKSSLT